MTVYYLISGNRVTHEINTDNAVTALPILASNQAVSLINRAHIIALMSSQGWTVQQFMANTGLVDERE